MTATTAKGRVGDNVSDITLPQLNGGEFDFGQLQGKKALLFFWGSW